METAKRLEQLDQLELARHAYGHAMGILSFDAATVAPAASAAGRGATLGVLTEASYRLFVNDETRAMLRDLKEASAELTEAQARRVTLLQKELDDMERMPISFLMEYRKVINDSSAIWSKAKQNNDFAAFEPHLTRVVEMTREMAHYIAGDKAPYDALLDDYEKGMSTATLDPFFALLRTELVPLIERVKHQPPEPSFVHLPCPVPAQRELAYELMRLMGVDRTRCILSETEHPFTTNMNNNDVRITTHYNETEMLSCLYTVVHESGHALYEMGMGDELQCTCLAQAASLGMHEGQSRFWENMVGHSRAFIQLITPTLKRLFPTLAGVTEDQLYRATGRVQPSLIRTEADEVTYPLHIMIRYELEKQLMNGSLAVRDLPAAWNAMVKDYLGVDVPTDREGVLQDMHWSEGMIGYFPTYALGSAYAAQLMAHLRQDMDVDSVIAAGELPKINEWLKQKIQRYGNLYDPAVLLEKACGEPFDPKYYVSHLCNRVNEFYAG